MRFFYIMFCSLNCLLLADGILAQGFVEPNGALKTYRFVQEGDRRRYKLYSPANVNQFNTPRPLVLVIHGGGSTDRGMMKLDKERWKTLADQHGFFVAYPNAIDKLWDFGEGNISNNLKKRVNDLAYFQRVIDDVSQHKQIDQSRIFATGISRGGQSSFYLACNMPERIRAIMSVAMSLPKFMQDDCAEGPPVGVAIMNGTADPQVPYQGGWITVFRKKRDIVLATNDTISLWRDRNGCANSETSRKHIDKPGDNTSVTIIEWSKCSGAPVKLFKVNSGGHTWPSGRQYLPVRVVGETSRDISASEQAWKFFSQF